MNFESALKDILSRVDGGLGASLVSDDGLCVADTVADDTLDLASIAAEFTTIFKNARRSAGSLSFGGVDEITVVTDEATLLLNAVTREYFLVLALSRDSSSLGRGRFELRRAILSFEKELI